MGHHRKRRRETVSSSRCVGIHERFHMCSEQPCPEPGPDLREKQCSSFDTTPYRGRLYRWRPHYSKARPCALTCRPDNQLFYVSLRSRVRDGTRCNPDGGSDLQDHICADGVCQHIGCDGVVGSARVRDACGVCGGRNVSCQIISGIFTEPRLKSGYSLVAQIPAGACSIHIEEMGVTKNYLALRDIRDEFIINGNWNIDNSGAYSGAGATFVYRRQPSDASANQGDRITSRGPITEPVDIVILYQEVNRGIKYEYAIKDEEALSSLLPRLPSGQRNAEPPGTLANSLLRPAGDQRGVPDQPPPLPSPGTGTFVSPLYQPLRPSTPNRVNQLNDAVSAPRRGGVGLKYPYLGQTDRNPRLGDGGRPSSARPPSGHPASGRPHPFSARSGKTSPLGRTSKSRARTRHRRRRRHRFQWVVRGYSACSRSCGGGTQMAQVVCVRRKHKQQVRDRKCDPRRRPQVPPRNCNTFSCPATWEPSAWSACSVTCGSGLQTRTFLCVRHGRPVQVSECPHRPAHPDTRPCRLQPCPAAVARWHVAEWSQCSVTCGWGTRTREVTCTSPEASLCPEGERPRERAPCQLSPCPPAPRQSQGGERSWMVTEWSQQCSVQCGRGVQWRGVVCGAGPDRCHVQQKPPDTRSCKTDRGCSGVWYTGPWSKCSHECGAGVSSRSVLCLSLRSGQHSVVPERACVPPRPDTQRRCEGRPPGQCPPRWYVTDWGACSVTCGPGSQSRTVTCVDAEGRRAVGCPRHEAPAARRYCTLAECPRNDSCTDKFGYCAAVQQARLCKYKYYKNSCCASCRPR